MKRAGWNFIYDDATRPLTSTPARSPQIALTPALDLGKFSVADRLELGLGHPDGWMTSLLRAIIGWGPSTRAPIANSGCIGTPAELSTPTVSHSGWSGQKALRR
jgi:hypothetical protein